MAQFAKGDSTEINEVAAMGYIVKHFEENKEPPDGFNHLIDVFLRVLSYPVSDNRCINSAYVIVKLIASTSASFAHTLIKKGALDHFVLCIRTATKFQDEKLVMNCLWGVDVIARHCDNCLKLVQATDVLHIIANKMHVGSIHTIMQCNAAVTCCKSIIDRCNFNSMQLETGRSLISAIVNALHRFNIDGNFYEICLDALTKLAHRGNYAKFDDFAAQFGEMLFDSGLISTAIDSISTGNPDLISIALALLINTFGCIDHKIPSATDIQQDKLNVYKGFIKIINDCLDSSWGTVRIRAAWALGNSLYGAPSKLINWFCEEVEVIAQLMCLMHHHDDKLQTETCGVFVKVFEAIADNSNDDSYSSLKLFVENGVRIIVNSATKSGADIRLVNMIKEVLPKQLLTHPEFCSRARKFIYEPEPFIDDLIRFKEDMRLVA